jgi:signal transduction histidine kinase
MTGLLFEREAALDRRRLLRLRPPSYPVSVALVIGAYYGAAKLGYEFSFSGPVAAIVWLPVGVGIAALYIGGLRLWPGVLIGDLLANQYMALPWGDSLVQTCGNVVEVVVAAALLRRLARRGLPLDTVSGVGSMLAAIAFGTAISATVGSLSLLAWHVVPANSLASVWRTWWLGDASGALVVVPLALAWSSTPFRPGWSSRRIAEGVVVLAVVGLLSGLGLSSHGPLVYLVFPALVWSAIRFGQRGASIAIVVTVGAAVWQTVHLHGPFEYHTASRNVLAVQLFAAVAALTTLVLGAVVAERETYADGLSSSRARIVEAADGERRRLERNLHDGAQHRLTALAYFLRTAAERTAEKPNEAGTLFERAEAEVELAIDELRELAHGIHPAVLTDLGLANALRSIAARSPVWIEFEELPASRADPTVEATAYYVVLEAVTNAQRHAQASRIRIGVAARPPLLHVTVEDDGVGGAVVNGGSGLQGLVDRVEAVGGTFGLRTAPWGGTRVEASIPMS